MPLHSIQNIDPVLWGPSAWSLLHVIGYHSTSSMETIRDLFEDLKILLPCTKCQTSYTHHLELLPFPSKRSTLFRWVYDLHHRINASLQTPNTLDTPPFAVVQKSWKGPRGIEKGIHDSWRFLFFLGMMFPSIQEKDKKETYQKALTHWMTEISKTLWHMDAPTCADMNSRTAFIRWLTDIYKQHNDQRIPPSYFLKRITKKCQSTCKI
jgi:hypothetical protein